MRLSAPLLTVVGIVAGTAAAVVAYQSTASPATPAPLPASDTIDRPAAPGTSWLPCEHGWKVQGVTCVRVKHRVVVVHDLPAPAPAPATTSGVRAPSGGTARDNGSSTGHAGNDQGEDQTDEATEGPDDSEPAGTEDVGGDD